MCVSVPVHGEPGGFGPVGDEMNTHWRPRVSHCSVSVNPGGFGPAPLQRVPAPPGGLVTYHEPRQPLRLNRQQNSGGRGEGVLGP